jgi:hypothetical protein
MSAVKWDIKGTEKWVLSHILCGEDNRKPLYGLQSGLQLQISNIQIYANGFIYQVSLESQQ